MPKVRVYEVAKELNIHSKEILDKLGEFGVDVKNHMSTMEDGDVRRIKDALGKKPSGAASVKQQAPPVRPQTPPAQSHVPASAQQRPRQQTTPAESSPAKRQDSIWRGEAMPATAAQQRRPMDSIWKSSNKPSQPQRQPQRSQGQPPPRPGHQPLQGVPQPRAARPPQPQNVAPRSEITQAQPQPVSSAQVVSPASPAPVQTPPPAPAVQPVMKAPASAVVQSAPAAPQPASVASQPAQAAPQPERAVQHAPSSVASQPKDRPPQQPPRQQSATQRPARQSDRPDGAGAQGQQHMRQPQGGRGSAQPSQANRPPRQPGSQSASYQPRPGQSQTGQPNRPQGSGYGQRPDRPQGGQGQRYGGQRQDQRPGAPRPMNNDRREGSPGARSSFGGPQSGPRPPRRDGAPQGGGYRGTQGGQAPRPGGAFSGPRPGAPKPAKPGFDASAGKGQRAGQKRTANKSGPAAKEDRGFVRKGAAPLKPGQKGMGYKRQDISKPSAKTSHKSRHKAAKPEPEVVLAPVVEEDGIKILRIGKGIIVKDLASRLDVPATEVIKQLMKRGLMVTLNQEVDYYTATQIAEGFGAIVEKADEIDVLEQAFAEEADDSDELSKPRPPIVVVMGHVDHGKTSLLDYIRKSKVAAREAGGITQHIGAYTVTVGSKQITFLDTPGHEAFTAMRMRGARVTDIAILVVAADDGVMPQTIEAINHAKAAGVEIIVAINKMDKPSANPDRVKQELTEHGVLVEEWGGEVISCPVSAIKGDGIDYLLEMILLVAEMKELKANPNKKARGTVIEALLDKARGPVATVLVQSGTLNAGDPVVAGSAYGRVRAMTDDTGRKLKQAGPSTPVEILGLSEVPAAGDMFYTANSEKHARQVAESVVAQGREDMIKAAPKVSLNDLFNQIQAGNVKDLNLVIKADVQGSVEAVKNSLERLSNDEVRIRALHGGVGAITESDVMLASASNAIIIGFNVKPENNAKTVADAENVDIRLYRIIYNAIEDITMAMQGMLEPKYQEKVIGHAEVRQIFKASGVGNIAGSYVTDGKITRNAKVRLYRGETKVFEGDLATLRRFKDDVKEVAAGYECGLLFTKFNDIELGDKAEAYIMEEVPR